MKNKNTIFNKQQYYFLTEVIKSLPLPIELKLTVVLHFIKTFKKHKNFNKAKFWVNCFTDIEHETELPVIARQTHGLTASELTAQHNTVAMEGGNCGLERNAD